MATNTVIFDQAYKILESIRSELRLNYDQGKISAIDKAVYFRINGSGKFVRCESDDENNAVVTVSWDSNNANLRTLAREVMHNLT